MYYIYDDNPTLGFVSVDGGTFMQTGLSVGKPGRKQQFTGSYSSQKYQKINNEHVVDSHFKVLKTPTKQGITPAALDFGKPISLETGNTKAQRIVEEYRNTEAPKQWQQKPQHQQVTNIANSKQKDTKQITQTPNNTPVRGDYGSKPKEATSRTQSSNKKQIQPIRVKAVNVDYTNLMKQRNQDSGNNKKIQDVERSQRTQDGGRSQRQKDATRSQHTRDAAYDTKTAYVEMNVRKASSDPQKKVLYNNNRQSTSLTVMTPLDKRWPSTMTMDKTLHKTNGIAHDHNMQVMSRVLDSMTQKITDRRYKKSDYVNSDTEKRLGINYEKSKRSVVADNMRKYIGKDKIGKDLRNQQKQNSALARIGSHEESLEQEATPYAVFYRMNPETLDRQEGFMIMRSLETENGSKDVASKEKRLRITPFQEDAENMEFNQKNGGGTLHRKKLKNFSNYRNF
ncbi:hypothetical protein PYW07_009164 [Mythimna separata]|uniref:Uncharacterized protein n=1 Tax=Mythimna separata TaxID=271217 RepID=A0AAD7YB25_MYTSE|nr:hypothetical protein PYW07_009164 [Mythimna separata]